MQTSIPSPNPDSIRLAYSLQETAQMLGVCDKSVRRLILRGLIRPSRALRHLRIPKDEIDRFLRESR
ncbi:MAG: helix-turn-helix domain-containing protein [Limisphaerales bacterium]